jgi:hypothetical protein
MSDRTTSNRPTYEQIWAGLQLAAEDVVFFNWTWWDKDDPDKLIPLVIVNDTFYYATADAEDLSWEELPAMLEIYRDKRHRCHCEANIYLIDWVAKKRGIRPLKEVEQMIEEGHWRSCKHHPESQKHERLGDHEER